MIGQTLSHFKITAKLGEGGMGEVYRAHDSKLGREVAIKVLPELVAADPERLSRFEREARLLAALDHPHIAAIYGLEEADGRQLLVMQLVEGDTLAERVARGAVPALEAAKIGLQITEALEAAHDKGIVHRDLKPANIKITPDGQVKVLDFGLAKALEEERASADLANSPTLTAAATQAGIILGTAAYMSPEQAAGEPADRRSDIWSFGVVLAEMLSGRSQFQGKTVSHVLAAVLKEEPDWGEFPRDLPPRLLELVQRCLRKDPGQRLQAIGDARVLLQEYVADPEAFAFRGATAEAARAPRPTWQRWLPWAVTAGLAVALAMALWHSGPSPQPLRRQSIQLPAQAAIFSGYGSSAEISPDGTRVAYVLETSGEHQLHLQGLDQWQGTLMVKGSIGGDGPYHPFFSPDSKWLGFVTPDELKKVPVTGGSAIKLCDVSLSRGAAWTASGSIIFAPSQDSGLAQVSAAGGQSQSLTELAEGETTHRWPDMLPDDRGVLFTVHTGNGGFEEARIEVLDLQTMERSIVHQGGSYARYVESGHVVFAHQGTLFAVPFDAKRLETTGLPVPVVENVRWGSGQGGAHFSVAADGTLVYVGGQSDEGGWETIWVDREGRASPLWNELRVLQNPRLSPDGGSFAVEILEDNNWDIWIFDIERQIPTRWTFGERFEGFAVWSPNGQHIAFAAQRDDGGIFIKAADGTGDAEPLTSGTNREYPWSFSPDGSILAFNRLSPDSGWDIHFLSLDNGEEEVFLATPAGESEPAFSPAGRWIAYDSDESGTWEVYVRPADGGRGKWQISNGGGSWPTWRADGQELFFISPTGDLMSVEVEAASGGFRASRPAHVFETRYFFRDSASYFDVAADGQRFLMFRSQATASPETHEHLRVVSSWFGDLERIFAETQ